MTNGMIAALFLFWAINSNASPVGGTGPISHAMGKTGRASVLATESIFLNPAFVSLARGYHLGVGLFNEEVQAGSSKIMNLSITDSTAQSAIPAALAVTRENTKINAKDVETTHYSLGFGGFQQKWAWGLTYRYGTFSESKTQYNSNQLDLGGLFQLSDMLTLGTVLYNLLGNPDQLPDEYHDTRQAAVALTWAYKRQFRLQADVLNYVGAAEEDVQISPWQYGFGIDTRIEEYLAFRFGWNRDEAENVSLATTGLAFIGPRLGLNYAYSRNILNEEEHSHRFDFSLPF